MREGLRFLALLETEELGMAGTMQTNPFSRFQPWAGSA